MAKEICNNCGKEMPQAIDEDGNEIKDTYYCRDCDKTFIIKNGKQFVAKGINAIEQIKNGLKNINERLGKVEKAQEEDDTLLGF